MSTHDLAGLNSTPDGRDAAEAYILAELAKAADELESMDARREQLLLRRWDLYQTGRKLTPPVLVDALATAARVSDAALTLSGRKAEARRARLLEAAS